MNQNDPLATETRPYVEPEILEDLPTIVASTDDSIIKNLKPKTSKPKGIIKSTPERPVVEIPEPVEATSTPNREKRFKELLEEYRWDFESTGDHEKYREGAVQRVILTTLHAEIGGAASDIYYDFLREHPSLQQYAFL